MHGCLPAKGHHGALARAGWAGQADACGISHIIIDLHLQLHQQPKCIACGAISTVRSASAHYALLFSPAAASIGGPAFSQLEAS